MSACQVVWAHRAPGLDFVQAQRSLTSFESSGRGRLHSTPVQCRGRRYAQEISQTLSLAVWGHCIFWKCSQILCTYLLSYLQTSNVSNVQNKASLFRSYCFTFVKLYFMLKINFYILIGKYNSTKQVKYNSKLRVWQSTLTLKLVLARHPCALGWRSFFACGIHSSMPVVWNSSPISVTLRPIFFQTRGPLIAHLRNKSKVTVDHLQRTTWCCKPKSKVLDLVDFYKKTFLNFPILLYINSISPLAGPLFTLETTCTIFVEDY